MSNLILVKPELGLETSKAEEIKNTFAPMVQMLENFENQCKEVFDEYAGGKGINTDLAKKAKKIRLAIRKVRTDGDRAHKEAKRLINLHGKAIDGARNILKWAVEEKENTLLSIEEHEERLRRIKEEQLREKRIKELQPYWNDSTPIPPGLGEMTDLFWENFLTGCKESYRIQVEAQKREAEAAEKEKELDILEKERYEKILPFKRFFTDTVETLQVFCRTASEENFTNYLHNITKLEIKEKEVNEKVLALKAKAEEKVKAERLKAKKKKEVADRKLAKEKENLRIAKEKLDAIEAKEKEQVVEKKKAEERLKNASDAEKLMNLVRQLNNVLYPHSYNKHTAKAIDDAVVLVDQAIVLINNRIEEITE